MEIKEYRSAIMFLEEHESILLEREAVSQLILYDAYQNSDHIACDQCLFGAVLEEAVVQLIFCNVYPYNLVIYTAKTDHVDKEVQLLADYIIDNEIVINGLNARNDVCQHFMEHYKKMTDSKFIERMEMDIMEIRSINEMKYTEGISRPALPGEIKLITDWMIQYQINTMDTEMDYEDALNKVTNFVRDKKVHLFETEEKGIVSMAIAARQLAHGIAISYIYTPEEFRGKGYAAANIYYVSKHYLENGNEFCSLFTDKNNPVLNRAYEKIGYYFLEKQSEYKIVLS